MNTLTVTTTVASILAIIMLPLTMQVTMRRIALGKAMGDIGGVAFGDGDDEVLKRRRVAFGNFVEYVPICLVMLGLLEYHNASNTLVWTVGGLLIASRCTHALSVLFTNNPAPKAAGMFMTYGAFIVPAIWLLFLR
ncbi:MAG: MAPEG family protein [Gammaproteobacteria bacterium]|nr:MAPEG family protein [Gammaproteobacteria bacterium]MDH5654033.1 MAPEG family protein [Gammaproteobacteria bacterium]